VFFQSADVIVASGSGIGTDGGILYCKCFEPSWQLRDLEDEDPVKELWVDGYTWLLKFV
jgi:hypothetical protein